MSDLYNNTVNLRLGKKIDIFGLKFDKLKNFNSAVTYLRSNRTSLFKNYKLQKVKRCPICNSSSSKSKFKVEIYGASYFQCLKCQHVYILERPTDRALTRFYSCNQRYAFDYTDKRMINLRVEQINIPKAKWMMERFIKLYGRKPKQVLDVGSGGGHFVYACKKIGLNARGIEISRSSRDFCSSNFSFNLDKTDFTKEWFNYSGADVVTFWGVIEHVSDPIKLLETAYKLLPKRGLVIIEVPRFDSLSTFVQSLFNNSVIRHLDPLHIQFFTDDSLAAAFKISKFKPTSSWYFGMDVYELLMQFSFFLKDEHIFKGIRKHIEKLQNVVDQAMLSDTIVLAGRPI